MIVKKISLILLLLNPAMAFASPSVFVRSESGSAWWISSRIESRVIGNRAGDVTAENLSKYIQDNQIYFSYEVCALAPVMSDTYVGVDKAAQDEIDKTRDALAPQIDVMTSDGTRLLVQSVLYEACDDPENRGAALLVTNRQTGDIVMWEPMGTYGTIEGASRPIITVFLSKSSSTDPDPPLFSYSHCYECSPSTAVYYDERRKKLYKIPNGA